jgi:basic membrane lipoprotein Med (substrate-binding protein (PBP1-ABC) superfamily)
MMRKSYSWLALAGMLALLALSACTALPAAAPAAAPTGPLQVFGAYATAIEEPWDGVIHAALNAAQEAGTVAYKYTDDIGYAGDMERVLREVAEKEAPAIIFGDAFGNEEAVRRVAADYPEIAFVFGSGGGPANPNFSVFDNWIHDRRRRRAAGAGS